MIVNFDVLACIVLPTVGYISMTWMKKKAKMSIELQSFSEGIYRLKPVHGERAVTLARSYARAGIMIFAICIILPFFFALVKYLH